MVDEMREDCIDIMPAPSIAAGICTSIMLQAVQHHALFSGCFCPFAPTGKHHWQLPLRHGFDDKPRIAVSRA